MEAPPGFEPEWRFCSRVWPIDVRRDFANFGLILRIYVRLVAAEEGRDRLDKLTMSSRVQRWTISSCES